MSDLKLELLVLINESNKTNNVITQTEVTNTLISKGFIPIDIFYAIKDLLHNELIKCDSLYGDTYAPLKVTTKGRYAIEDEQKRLADENPNPKRANNLSPAFWCIVGIFGSFVVSAFFYFLSLFY